MKKALLVLVVTLVVAVAATQSAYAGGLWRWDNNNDADEIARHNAMHGRQNLYPNRYYYPNGHYGYGTYGYGPGPNTDVRSRERWEGNKGEREFSQTQNLPAKVIDAVTILGAIGLIFH